MVDVDYYSEQKLLPLKANPRKRNNAPQLSQISTINCSDSSGTDNLEKAEHQKKRNLTEKERDNKARREKLDGDIKYVLFKKGSQGTAGCLRKGINEIFDNISTRKLPEDRCCSRYYPYFIKEFVSEAAVSSKPRLRVRQDLSKKRACINGLKLWRTVTASEIFD
jgi:hypothetical protein